MKKIFLFSIIVCTLLLSSCNGNRRLPAESTLLEEETKADAFRVDSLEHISIIKPFGCSESVSHAAETLQKAIGETVGTEPEIITDKAASSDGIEGTALFVGFSTRFERTFSALSLFTYGEYGFSVINGEMFVCGWSKEDTVAASKLLADHIKENYMYGLDIPSDTFVSKKSDRIVANLPVFSGVLPESIYECGDSCKMVLLSADADRYAEYNNTLINAGFDLKFENEIADNLYSAYSNGSYIVNTMRMSDGKVRLFIEPYDKTELPSDSVPEYSEKYSSSLSLIGGFIDEDTTEGGLCCIYRLADGSFIIIDGGYKRDADRIFDYISKNTVSEKPNIAAWIFTHAHSDHVDAFLEFSEKYSSRVSVENFICNFPSETQREITGDAKTTDLCKVKMKSYPGAKIIKAHPGQKFMIRNAEIEIYYTLELYAPKKLDYYNDCSLVFGITLSGTKTMFTGDISPNVAPLIASLYKESLACDIMQIAHHGYAGDKPQNYTELNSYLDPTYALWPSGQPIYESRYKKYAHCEPLRNSAKLKKIFVAGNGITELLPDNGKVNEIK